MKIKRIRAGEYEFTNNYGGAGLILAQPEGGWTVYDPNAGRIMHNDEPMGETLEFFMFYSDAKDFARELQSRNK